MHINCPGCGFQFDLSSDLIGVHVRCSNCNTKFQFFEDGKTENLEESEPPAETLVETVDDGSRGEVFRGKKIDFAEEKDFFDQKMYSFSDAMSNAKSGAVEAYIFFGAAAVFIVCIVMMAGMLIFRGSINRHYAGKDKAAAEKIALSACHRKLALTGSLFLRYARENGNKLPTTGDFRKTLAGYENENGYCFYCLDHGLYEANAKVVSLDAVSNKAETPLVYCKGHKLAFFADGKLNDYEEGGK